MPWKTDVHSAVSWQGSRAYEDTAEEQVVLVGRWSSLQRCRRAAFVAITRCRSPRRMLMSQSSVAAAEANAIDFQG